MNELATTAGAWLVPEAGHGMPLVIVPHAGAGPMAYRGLARALGDCAIPLLVQLPGRERRRREPPVTRVEPIVTALVEALTPVIHGEYVLYGHSYGALLAFEVARRAILAGGREPLHLVVSSFSAPRVGIDDRFRSRLRLDDAQLWREILLLGGVPPQVAASDMMRQLLIPAFRADFEAIAHWVYQPSDRLRAPLTALAGRDDREAPPDLMSGWRWETTGEFRMLTADGGHFFNFEDPTSLVEALRASLRSTSVPEVRP